ncbi:MAG TPA: hypothetical protein VGK67_15825 [Myxococcales bacterium]|jgi:hypothetical protein
MASGATPAGEGGTPAPAPACSPAERRALFITLAAMLGATAAWLWSLPYLPFQDVPNHLHVLKLANAVADGRPVEGMRARDFFVFGYSAYFWVGRVLRHVFTAEQTLGAEVVFAAMALPASLMLVARRLGSAAHAGWLALPLALSWPLRMGFVPYALALPFFFVWLRALPDLRDRRWLLGGAAALTASYVAHPMPYTVACPLAVVAFLTLDERRLAHAARLAATLALPAAMLVADWLQGTFSQIEGTEQTWEPSPLIFRAPWHAVRQLVSRTLALTGPRDWLLAVPLLLLFAWLLVRKRDFDTSPPSREKRFLAWATGAAFALAAVTPHSIGTTWLWGDRVGIFGFALLPVLLSNAWAGWRSPLRFAAPLAILPLVFASWGDVRSRALEIRSRLEPAAHAPLKGRYLTYRLSELGLGRLSWNHGDYDSMRQTCAYVLSLDGRTPYLFAFARYLPVWFDSQQFQEGTPAPREWDANEGHSLADDDAANAFDLRQIRKALEYRGYDGVIVFGSARRVEKLGAQLPAARLSPVPIGPGVLMFPIAPTAPSTP